jgi:type 1 glutamine amidotransferase
VEVAQFGSLSIEASSDEPRVARRPLTRPSPHPRLTYNHPVDEICQFTKPYSRDNVRVLLSLDTKKTNMGVPWIKRDDNDFALAWVRQEGKGRVFYCSLGHRTELYWDPKLLQFYLADVQFRTGDLDAPAKPQARASKEFGP